jgi:hypothetical protein
MMGLFVLLIAAGGAYLAVRQAALLPTPGATVVPTTLAVAIVTSSPTPATATPVPPTFTPAPPTPIALTPPEQGRLVEVCQDTTPPQICVRDVKTGQATPLTSELKFGLIDQPVWSGDGRQIAFTAGSDWRVTGQYDHQLYVVNADGSELRQVTHKNKGNATFPAWSPDGRWIAYNNGCALWIARPNGLDAQELVPGCKTFAAESMAWSPDGQQIAALNNHVDIPATEIWVVNRNGSNPHRIYTHDRKGFMGGVPMVN